MGDLVHALPAVSDIARAYPDAQIDWVAERPFDAIARLHPAVHRVIPLAWRKWRKTIWRTETRRLMSTFKSQLNQTSYDVVIDLQGLLKSVAVMRLARLSQSPDTIGYCGYDKHSIREPLASFFYQHRFQVSRHASSVARNRALTAAALGIDDSPLIDFGLRHMVMPTDWNDVLPNGEHPEITTWVALIHGASRDSKLWDIEQWFELMNHLAQRGQRTLLIWGNEAERLRSEKLLRMMQSAGWSEDVLPIVPGFLTITQVAQCLAVSVAVVGLDSGFTHLAGALSRPTVGIYRDFDPELASVMGLNYCVGVGGVGAAVSSATVIEQLDLAIAFDVNNRSRWAENTLHNIERSPSSTPQAVLYHISPKV